MNLTAAELTVLSLVVERPSHGYDLERVVDERGIRWWTDIGFSSIYYVLTKLEKRELIAADEARARSRRVFHATAQGRAVAAEAARALITGSHVVHDPVLVGLANLSLLTDRDYEVALRTRLVALDARIVGVRAAAESQSPLPVPASEVFSYTLRLLDAERSWLAERVQEFDD
jgi:DNA-binding PadR family transcriptional regulator